MSIGDMASKVYIIDGHALIFRMYYAFVRRPMINSKGEDMSILFGFTKYLLEMVARCSPTHLAVAFDPPGGTFRNEMYPAYKANRAETPQLVIDALEPLTELCGAMGIPVLMERGFEADDVVGTLAKKFGSPRVQVYMVTPDKDYGQLIDENIFQLKPGKAGGPDELVGVKEVCAKYGISSPSQVIEMLTLCGDASDNVPGVKGVGEVGAAKLIAKYGTVENIYSHIGELSPRQREMFDEARPHIGLSHELVTIKTDVPLDVQLESMKMAESYSPLLAELFDRYEFRSLKKHIEGKISGEAVQKADKSELKFTEDTAGKVCSEAVERGAVALCAYGDGLLAAAAEGPDGAILACRSLPKGQEAILFDKKVEKLGFNLKGILRRHPGLKGKLLDIELMHYLISPEESHNPDDLGDSFLGVAAYAPREEEGAPEGLFDMAEDSAGKEEALGSMRLAALSCLLAPAVRSELEKKGLASLYDDMEEPLIRVLAGMEDAGVKVDLESLNDFTEELRVEIKRHESAVREMSGDPSLNVSSPMQVGNVLFRDLKLDPKAKKGAKGSYTTDEATLTALYDRHPIIGEILEFRAAKKLLSTYIEPLPSYVSKEDGRIHTTFNQALTATGRLSSSSPNLQNIPIRTERGMTIRRAFVPATPEGFILSADYSQIELRIMAHLSGDEHLTAAFRDGVDVHSATAAKIYRCNTDEVTHEQRRIAKTANFGIIYGISSFGLAQRLHISVGEARKIISDYFAAFPQVYSYIERCKDSARRDGFVETLFGRRRYLPLINSSNRTMRELSERNAVNAPIQGTSADIIKLAMVRIDRRMRDEGFRSRMILQIHDELLFDTLPGEREALKALVKEEMEGVTKLSVPLTVECNYGKNWLEAH